MTSADAEAVFEIFSDEEVLRYYDLEALSTREQALELIERQNALFQSKAGVRWGITLKTEGPVIGTCGLRLASSFCGEVGYDLARAYWSQGIMTEALRAVLRFGFGRVGLHRIQAHVMIGNTASDRLLEKLGFQLEGVLRQYGHFKGAFHDLKSFSILSGEFVE